MLSLLVLAAAPVAFNGGSPSELAKSIAEATQSNVVIEAGPYEHLKGFAYDPANANEMANVILKVAELKQAPGENLVFYHPWLPTWHFQQGPVKTLVNDSMRPSTSGSFPDDGLKDGKVTIHTSVRRGLPISCLTGGKFSKPLSVDPFFDHCGLSIWVDDMPERDFLNYAAKAAGAKLNTSKGGYSFEPSGQEIQRRALATIERAKKEKGFAKLSDSEKADVELSRAAIASVTPAQLEMLVNEGDKPIRVEIGPAARQAVVQILKAAMEQQRQAAEQSYGPPNSLNPREQQLVPQPGDRYRNLDRRIVGWVFLSKGFQAYAELQTVDQLGRPGPPMRVP